MRNKFLIMAVATALLAFAIMPAALAVTATGGTASVTVAASGTYSVTLSGNHTNPSFGTGIAAYTSSDTATITLATITDYISVNDLTGSSAAGHEVSMKFTGNPSWVYSGDAGATDLVNTGTSNTGAGASLALTGPTSELNFVQVTSEDSGVCTRVTTPNSITDGNTFITNTYKELFQTTQECAGTTQYSMETMTFYGPTSAGMADGSYTISARVLVTDGTT